VTVIEFKRPESPVPHARGPALCIDCKNRWEAVVDEQALRDADGWLECPVCGLYKGRMQGPFMPMVGSKLWHCQCNCNLFHITPAGVHCPNCGRTQEFPK
jgi:hypothetical protein